MAIDDLHGLISTVETSDAFIRFVAAAPDRRLVHVFAQGSAGETPAEIGYYDPIADAITVFGTREPITASEAQEVFRGEDPNAPTEELLALPLADLTVGIADARALLKRLADDEYPAHPIAQEILILRQRAEVPVWSATLLTHTLHVLLVELDARDGAVRSRDLRNILDLRAPE